MAESLRKNLALIVATFPNREYNSRNNWYWLSWFVRADRFAVERKPLLTNYRGDRGTTFSDSD
ncbi:hypothetical protein [Myxosarcina sp. GI1(2024)]